MKSKLETLLNQLIELQIAQNTKLDKIAGLLTSEQLLTECIDHQGNTRDGETCAQIVIEAFSAALCLNGDLDQRTREYQYQKQEFFIEDDEEDGNDEDNLDGPAVFATSF
jgi:hypothetical protein